MHILYTYIIYNYIAMKIKDSQFFFFTGTISWDLMTISWGYGCITLLSAGGPLSKWIINYTPQLDE